MIGGRPLQEGFEQRDFNEPLTAFMLFLPEGCSDWGVPGTRQAGPLSNEGEQSAGQKVWKDRAELSCDSGTF